MTRKTLDDIDLAGRKVLVRTDINVPMKEGRVTDDTRLRAAVPTIRDVLARGGVPMVLAHFGRPKGQAVPSMSLRPLAEPLSQLLGAPVAFCPSCIGPRVAAALEELPEGGVLLLENTRFHPGEEANDPAFAAELAHQADIYVNDAFSAAHRAHASTEGLAHLLPAVAGRQMEAELEALEAALSRPERPVIAVVGGAKVSTKLALLGNLIDRVDRIAIGGAMANTFLAAQGHDVGRSLQEADLHDTAREIMARAEAAGAALMLPTDAVVATEFAPGATHKVVAVDTVPDDTMILDCGPETVARLAESFREARTLVWNGPLGAFETPPFDVGTVTAAQAAAEATEAGTLLSVAGGGDTVAALNAAGVAGRFSYVSTAGGAFLEWLEGKTLPGVAALG
jgi:phosphoglycerate kinase